MLSTETICDESSKSSLHRTRQAKFKLRMQAAEWLAHRGFGSPL